MNRTTRANLLLLLGAGFMLFAPACSQDDADHADHDEEEADHMDGGGEVVRLDADEAREFGVEVAEAGPGELRIEVVLPGEVKLNPDSIAHITPRVPGVVRKVHKGLGDAVKTGDLVVVPVGSDPKTLETALLGRGARLCANRVIGSRRF